MANGSKKAVLHLSDLHINSFRTNEFHKSKAEEPHFIEILIENLQEIMKNDNVDIKQIIISGDLSNKATPLEYKNVKEFLDKLLNGINCSWENVIMVPGNHDINWCDCESELQDRELEDLEVDPSTFYDVKLKKFKEFYDKNFKEEFDCKKVICSQLYDKEFNILYIGINSLYKESNKEHIGFICEEDLKKELDELDKKYSGKKPYKIAIFHHPADYGIGESKVALSNWSDLKKVFNKHDIRIFNFGHVHRSVKTEFENNIYLGCSTLALDEKKIRNGFLLYTIDREKKEFIAEEYVFSDSYMDHGKWLKDTEFKLFTLKDNVIMDEYDDEKKDKGDIKSSPFQNKDLQNEELLNTSKLINMNLGKSNTDSNKLIEIVKDEGMFCTGHFHWGDNLKAHGWLNTNLLLYKHKNISLSIKAVLKIILQNEINPDIIIGIGMEGNIIGSLIAIILDKKYTYVPANNRDSTEYESDIYNINETKILFVADTIFSGNTIDNILKNYKNKMIGSKEISFVSLFCTGDMDEIRKKIEFVKFYCVCDKIKIKLCNQSKEECMINKYKLDKIYEF